MDRPVIKHEVVIELKDAISYFEEKLKELVGHTAPTGFGDPVTRSLKLKEHFEKTLNPLIKTFISMDLNMRSIEETLINLAEYQKCVRRITKAFHSKNVEINRETLREATIDEADTISNIYTYSYDLNRDLDSLYFQVHTAKNHKVRFDLVEFRDALKALSPFTDDTRYYGANIIAIDVNYEEMTIYATDNEVVGIKKMSCRSESEFSFGVITGKTHNSGFSLVELLSTYNDGKIDLELSELNYIVRMRISEIPAQGMGKLESRYRLFAINDEELHSIKINSDQWVKLFTIRYDVYKEHYDSYRKGRKSGEYTSKNHFGLWFWDAVKTLSDFNTSTPVESYIHLRIKSYDLSLVANNGQAYVEVEPYINDISDQCPKYTVISVDGRKLKKLSRFFEKSEAYVFLSDNNLIFQSIDGKEIMAISCESVRGIDEGLSWHTAPSRLSLAEGEIGIKDGHALKSLVNSVNKDKHLRENEQGLEIVFNNACIKSIETKNTKGGLRQDVNWLYLPSPEDVNIHILGEVKVLLPLNSVRILKKILSKLMGSKNMPYVFWYDISMRNASKDVYSERFALTLYAHDMEIVFLLKRTDIDVSRASAYSEVRILLDELYKLKDKVGNLDERLLEYPFYGSMYREHSYSLDRFDAPEEWKTLICELSDEELETYKRFYMVHVEIYNFLNKRNGKISHSDFSDYDIFSPKEDPIELPAIDDDVSYFDDTQQSYFQNMSLEDALESNWWGWWANSNAAVLYAIKQSKEHRTVSIRKSYYKKDIQEYLQEYGFEFKVINEYDDMYRILLYVEDEDVIRHNSNDERSVNLEPNEYFLLRNGDIKIKGSSDRVTFY